MHLFRKKFKEIPLIQALSSIKITVTCLSLLLALTFLGTIDQVYNGLYHAQENYFHSWIFPLFGFLPFPGAQLVLWILFINLVFVALTKYIYKLSYLGILIIHFGLLTYFVAAFVTFRYAKESNITLREGEASNLSSAYHDWELSIWKEEQNKRHVMAYTLKNPQEELKLNFDEFGLEAIVQKYYSNSEAYQNPNSNEEVMTHNDSGIQSLRPIALVKEPEKNIPGGIFTVIDTDQRNVNLILYGGESDPTKIFKNGQTYYAQLRRKRMPLPFILKLKDFRMEKHPNTDIARSYQSLVQIQNQNLTRDVLISMNKPLRYKDFTIYQASYSIDAMGRELSTLAVVKNFGRLMPYIASLITFIGLLTQFLVMGLLARVKK